MQNYILRIRIYDPINGFIIPGMGSYHEEDFKCNVEQIFKEDDNTIIFSVSMPYNYVVRLRDTYMEKQAQARAEEQALIEEDDEDEEEQNVTDEFGNLLDILSHEVKDFRSDIRDTIELLADELEDIKPDREQLEKLKKIRADLEKLNLEFGEILWTTQKELFMKIELINDVLNFIEDNAVSCANFYEVEDVFYQYVLRRRENIEKLAWNKALNYCGSEIEPSEVAEYVKYEIIPDCTKFEIILELADYVEELRKLGIYYEFHNKNARPDN